MDSSETHLYSLAYSKQKEAMFYSHLDTLRILERTLRRSGLPICFTQGCNPHIKLSFYNAAPLGVATKGEWFTLRLEREMDPEEIKDRINGHLISGFSIVKAIKGRPQLDGDEEYICLIIKYLGSMERAMTAASRFMDQSKVEVSGVRKKKAYTRDVRPNFTDFKVEDGKILFFAQAVEENPLRVKDLVNALYERLEIEALGVEIEHPSISERFQG